MCPRPRPRARARSLNGDSGLVWTGSFPAHEKKRKKEFVVGGDVTLERRITGRKKNPVSVSGRSQKESPISRGNQLCHARQPRPPRTGSRPEASHISSLSALLGRGEILRGRRGGGALPVAEQHPETVGVQTQQGVRDRGRTGRNGCSSGGGGGHQGGSCCWLDVSLIGLRSVM